MIEFVDQKGVGYLVKSFGEIHYKSVSLGVLFKIVSDVIYKF